VTDPAEGSKPGEEPKKPADEPKEPPESPDVQSVALAGITKGREAAKWLVGALAAVAALLVAGTQLSSIGEVEGWRLAFAALCAVAGLSLLGIALFASFRLMAPIALSIDEIARRTQRGNRNDPSVRFLRENPSVFVGQASDAADLEAKRKDAERELAAALAAHRKTPDDKALEAAAEAAGSRLEQLDAVANSATEFGTYAAFRQRLAVWERTMAVALVVVGLALVGFAWAANPPDDDDGEEGGASGANLRGVTLADVDFSRTDLSGVDFSYATLTGVNLRAATTDGTIWEGVVWDDVTCVDGRNSNDVGGSCEGHLGSD